MSKSKTKSNNAKKAATPKKVETSNTASATEAVQETLTNMVKESLKPLWKAALGETVSPEYANAIEKLVEAGEKLADEISDHSSTALARVLCAGYEMASEGVCIEEFEELYGCFIEAFGALSEAGGYAHKGVVMLAIYDHEAEGSDSWGLDEERFGIRWRPSIIVVHAEQVELFETCMQENNMTPLFTRLDEV